MTEPEQFTSIEQKQSKHRGSQLLVIAALAVVVLGAVWSIDGQWYGFVLLGGGLAALIALTVWAIKNWDW
jgi:hypothetical protein